MGRQKATGQSIDRLVGIRFRLIIKHSMLPMMNEPVRQPDEHDIPVQGNGRTSVVDEETADDQQVLTHRTETSAQETQRRHQNLPENTNKSKTNKRAYD
jgi:hypothetical protein